MAKKKRPYHRFNPKVRAIVGTWLKTVNPKRTLAKVALAKYQELSRRHPVVHLSTFEKFLKMVYREKAKLAKAKKTTVKRVAPKGNTSARESQAQEFIAERGTAKVKKPVRKRQPAPAAPRPGTVLVKGSVRVSEKSRVLDPAESKIVCEALTRYHQQRMAALEAMGVVRLFEAQYGVAVAHDGKITCRIERSQKK